MPTKIRGTLLNCRPAFIHDCHRSAWRSPRQPTPAVARLQFRWRWRNYAEDDFLNAKKLAKRKRHLMNQARIAEPKGRVVSANPTSGEVGRQIHFEQKHYRLGTINFRLTAVRRAWHLRHGDAAVYRIVMSYKQRAGTVRGGLSSGHANLPYRSSRPSALPKKYAAGRVRCNDVSCDRGIQP